MHGLIYPNINIISNFFHSNKIKHKIFLFTDLKKIQKILDSVI
jgi:hypothetical protein